MRARTNISLKDKHVETINGFRGCDFSSSATNVAKNRSPKMKNLICENGLNRKRKGWRELLHINGVMGKINGLYGFKRPDGVKVLLIYAGKRFFVCDNFYGENGKVFDRPIYDYHIEALDIVGEHNELEDNFVEFIENKGSVFCIGAGDYFCYGENADGGYELSVASDGEHVYIPTTTTGINKEQFAYENVNLLTRLRYNKAYGVKKEYEYTLIKEEKTKNSGGTSSVKYSYEGEYSSDRSYTISFYLDGIVDFSKDVEITINDKKVYIDKGASRYLYASESETADSRLRIGIIDTPYKKNYLV